MYERPFRLELIAPDRVVFRGEVTSVSAPGVAGGFQVLVDHAPLLAALAIGPIKVRGLDGGETFYASSGGFAEVKQNAMTILVESAERADQIDVKRAEAAQERAAQRLRTRAEEIDLVRARASLARALNRLRIASRA